MRWAVIVGLVVAFGTVSVARADNLIVVIDRSMPVEKLCVVTDSLRTALADIDPSDRIAVIAAGATASTEVALQRLGDGTQAAQAIARISWSERGSVPAGLRAASAVVAQIGAKKGSGATRVLVITDAVGLPGIEKQSAALAKAGARVSALSYQGENKGALEAIARGGGTSTVVASKRELVDNLFAQSRDLEEIPLAVVLVLDRSGSMQGAKLEAAKEAARVTVEVLAPNDWVAIVAFDSESQVFVRPQRAANKMRISTEIARITTGGGTNIFPGLKEANEILRGINGVRRHVILLTDGEAPADGIAELVDEMRANRITVSAVGVMGADRNLLSLIADHGDGRLYMVDDLGSLPKIFMKETRFRQ